MVKLAIKMPLPSILKKYFWGDDLKDISWSLHKKYIIQTLLEKGGSGAIRWLFSSVNKVQLVEILPKLKLSKKSLNFWKIYLS